MFAIKENLTEDKFNFLLGTFNSFTISLQEYIKDYSIQQLIVILEGIKNKVDVKIFTNPIIPADAMKIICDRLIEIKLQEKEE